MATIAQLRQAIKARLETIDGLRAHAYWPASVQAPAAVVDLLTRQPHARACNGSLYTFRITLLIAPATIVNDAGQMARDEYLDAGGAKSVQGALEGDGWLDGLASALTCRQVESGPVLEWPLGSTAYWWGGTLELEVLG